MMAQNIRSTEREYWLDLLKIVVEADTMGNISPKAAAAYADALLLELTKRYPFKMYAIIEPVKEEDNG